MKEVIFGLDGKINLENLKNCINDLANNIGNLTNRVFTIVEKNYDNQVPDINENYTINSDLILDKFNLIKFINNYEIHNYVKEIHSYSSKINKYVNDNEPWNKKKNTERNIKNIIYSSLYALKNIFILLYPIMPNKSIEFLKNINISEKDMTLSLLDKNLDSNQKILKPKILFKKY